MLLLRTVCNTDWKGRPSHHVTLVAKTKALEEAIEAMNKNVAEWMAADIAADEYNAEDDLSDDWDEVRTTQILTTKTPDEILQMWRHKDRFEMRLQNVNRREFVDRSDDNLCTIVYHFLNDDHTYLKD